MNQQAMTYQFHRDNSIPKETEGYVWVFGSNLAGRHGMGAAKVAHVGFGMPYGKGEGRAEMAYAIPTKDRRLNVLPLEQIALHVGTFLSHAYDHGTDKFWVTRVGCGLAGYEDCEMAPLFRRAPANCNFPQEWREYLR
jgi:hypothetical protein